MFYLYWEWKKVLNFEKLTIHVMNYLSRTNTIKLIKSMKINDLTPPANQVVSTQTGLKEHKNRPVGIATRIERVSNSSNIYRAGSSQFITPKEKQHFDMLFERCINTATNARLARKS